MSETLMPEQQREIDFYGDSVIAVQMEDGAVYVPVRPLCDLLGVSWQGQSKKLKNDPILSEVKTSVNISLQKSDGAMGTRTTNMVALPLDALNGWLYGINANKVKPEIRESLLRYQRECYRVLFEAFNGKAVVVNDTAVEAALAADPELREAHNLALATLNLIRSHAKLVGRIDRHEERIGLLEAKFADPAGIITRPQAESIAQAVKTIALKMRNQDGRNHFGRVYNELYARYDITGYKELPAAKYDDAIQWLRGWWSEVATDDSVPF